MLSDAQTTDGHPEDLRGTLPSADAVDDWTVVVATRGDAKAASRIGKNIVEPLPGVPVLVVRNGRSQRSNLASRGGVEVIDAPGGGVSRARNAAFAAAKTRTLVFVDDDVIVSEAALRTLVTRQRQVGAAIATARVRAADTAHHPLFDDDLGFDRGTVCRTWRLGVDKPVSPLNVWDFGVGATFAVDKPLLDAGGRPVRFDERLSNGRFCGGTEDVDLFYSAYVAGHTVCYVGDAVVGHLFPATETDVHAKCRQYALSDGAFYAKWARRVSVGDLRREAVGWGRRVVKARNDRQSGRAAVPLSVMVGELVYKMVGGATWALALRRSS